MGTLASSLVSVGETQAVLFFSLVVVRRALQRQGGESRKRQFHRAAVEVGDERKGEGVGFILRLAGVNLP